jgi:chemotaxis protein MotB
MRGNAGSPPSPEAAADTAQEQKLPNPSTEPRSAEERRQLAIQQGAAQVEKELAQLIETLPPTPGPNITVKAVPEGILISLTDDTKFNMFKIASAMPSPELVYFLEKLGSIVNKHPGKIVIRGHTDGRPYAGDTHGNWRLSANRATATYYMLMRGNVGDGRFFALEGYAERDLRNKANPLAGENRRIEILIRVAEEP